MIKWLFIVVFTLFLFGTMSSSEAHASSLPENSLGPCEVALMDEMSQLTIKRIKRRFLANPKLISVVSYPSDMDARLYIKILNSSGFAPEVNYRIEQIGQEDSVLRIKELLDAQLQSDHSAVIHLLLPSGWLEGRFQNNKSTESNNRTPAQALNAWRDSMFNYELAVFFWLPHEDIPYLVREAPDLWSWLERYHFEKR